MVSTFYWKNDFKQLFNIAFLISMYIIYMLTKNYKRPTKPCPKNYKPNPIQVQAMHTSFTRRGSASPVRLGRAWLLHSYEWDVDQPPQFDWLPHSYQGRCITLPSSTGYPIATKGGVSLSPVRLGRARLLHSYQRTWISLLSSTGKSLATP